MLNMRFHCGFSFNWDFLKKWILPILIGVLILFSQKLSVYAYTCDSTNSICYFQSGDSLKNVAKIGNMYVGNNSSYSAGLTLF